MHGTVGVALFGMGEVLGFGGNLYSDFKSGFSQASQSSSDSLFSKVAKLLNFVISTLLHESALSCPMHSESSNFIAMLPS